MAVCPVHSIFAYGINLKLISIYILPYQEIANINTVNTSQDAQIAALQNASNSGSTSIALNGTSFERAALTGDVTATQNSNALTIAANAVTSAKILDGTIATADLADASITAAKLNQPVKVKVFLKTNTLIYQMF
jgi:hypothetical protein